MSITAMRNVLTAAGATPASFNQRDLLRQMVTKAGGTPTQWDQMGLMRELLTAMGGTPTQTSSIGLLKQVVAKGGGSAASFDPDILWGNVVLAQPFTPALLFAGSQKGFWFDPSDDTTVTTATGISQINDKSGNANHAVQATGANQPVRFASGAVKLMDFDGAGDGLSIPSVSLGSNMSIFTVIEVAAGETGFALFHDATVEFMACGQSGGGGTAGSPGGNNRPGSVAPDETYWIDGQQLLDTTALLTGTTTTRDALLTALTPGSSRHILEIRTAPMDNWATFSMANYGGFGFDGALGEIVCCPDPDAITRAQMLTYLAAKWGVTLAAQSANVTFPAYGQEGEAYNASGRYITPPFARAKFTTSATSIDVHSYNNVYGVSTSFAELGLKVDGVWQAVQLAGTGHQTNSVALAAGTKTIEIINGMQINGAPSTSPYTASGSWLTYLTGNATITPVPLDGQADVLIYGDSISVGRTVTKYTRDTSAILLRGRLSASVGVEGADGKMLYNDMLDAPTRAKTKRIIARWAPKVLVDRLGVNDYILAAWDHTAFETAYGQFIDDVHASLPSCKFICVTQYPRTTETANGVGSTLEQYRQAKRNVAAARASYCTVLEGPTVYSVSDLVDTVHPGDAGNVKMANAEQPLILALLSTP